MEENTIENKHPKNENSSQQIAGAIILAGFVIAGAIFLKGNTNTEPKVAANDPYSNITLAKVSANDRTRGNEKAKVALVMYEDFQCPFCAAISGLVQNTDAIKYLKERVPNWTPIMSGLNEYIKNGTVLFTYRDYAFLGTESRRAAEAARCAGDQGKFWEYHDYLYLHQKGENQGNFSDPYLKSFAKGLGLNPADFDKCLDENKYAQAVADSKTEGDKAGVTGTPKGFILKNGKIVATIDGAESWTTVKPKIDGALK